MPTIQLLDEKTINQIAAGEVIEQPASVVKELIDNALDAGATKITVEIKGGGRQQIKVSDNGIGMSKEDAHLSLQRHATSKLRKVEDLESLHTLGFRGEALSSISAISKFRLMTKQDGAALGTLLQSLGGELISAVEAPMDKGTTFEIEDLFFNVPARLKFLKSPQHNSTEIKKVIVNFALIHPEVSFELVSDGKKIIQCQKVSADDPFQRLKERLTLFFSEEETEKFLPVNYEEEGIKIWGFISPPTLHRPSRNGQLSWVNQRAISAWPFSHAVVDGYGPSLEQGRHPLFALHLTVPPKELDVNVHPQKKEVRFRHELKVKEALRFAIMNAFRPNDGIDITRPPVSSSTYYSPQQFEKTFTPFVKEEEQLNFWNRREENKSSPLKILGYYPPYILMDCSPFREDEKGLYLVHSGRARARILYEDLMQKKENSSSQGLLTPRLIQISDAGFENLQESLEKLKGSGFSLRHFGEKTLILEAVPGNLSEEEALEILEECLAGGFQREWEKKLAIRLENQRKPFHEIEMIDLIERLRRCQQPQFSLSGKGIVTCLQEKDLEGFFR